MAESDASYRQPEKILVRRQLLAHAVETLTVRRSDTALVRRPEFEGTIDYAIRYLTDHVHPFAWLPDVRKLSEEFLDLVEDSVGQRAPRQLKVLYLCGPEPTNDLGVLLEFGCRPENIWGVESESRSYEAAIRDIATSGIRARIHHGNLRTFFEQVNERFDLIYYDGCGALPGGKPNSILPLLALFAEERLAPVGALVTTFTTPPVEKQAVFNRLMSYFFSPRYNEVPRALHASGVDPAIAHHAPEYLEHFISNISDEVYEDFVTRLVVDLGRGIVPLSRVAGNPDLMKKYFSESAERKSAIAAALAEGRGDGDDPPGAGDLHVAPDAYPLLSFLHRVAKDPDCRSLMDPLLHYSMSGTPIRDAIANVSVLENLLEGHVRVASPEILAAVRTGWFDYKGRQQYFCDVPLPKLIINALVGIYSHPYLYNPAASKRLRYTAKERTMLSDVVALDQCRYFFDFLPTIDLIPSWFQSHAYQLVVRAAMDRIAWHDFGTSSRPFSGAALGGLGEHRFAREISMQPRTSVQPGDHRA